MDKLSKLFEISISVWVAQTKPLVGGSDRPPSQRMIEQARADEQARRNASRQQDNTLSPTGSQPSDRQEEGYWAYMQRQVQERTENLGLAGDSMDKLEDNSQGFADDINKYVNQQKKKAVMGCKFCPQMTFEKSSNFLGHFER